LIGVKELARNFGDDREMVARIKKSLYKGIDKAPEYRHFPEVEKDGVDVDTGDSYRYFYRLWGLYFFNEKVDR
jgi:hypothetical protein